MKIEPGRKYRVKIHLGSIHNGIIHVPGIVNINQSTPVAVVARWKRGMQLWHLHTMSILILQGYCESGWLTDAGPTEHDVTWGWCQMPESKADLPLFFEV